MNYHLNIIKMLLELCLKILKIAEILETFEKNKKIYFTGGMATVQSWKVP